MITIRWKETRRRFLEAFSAAVVSVAAGLQLRAGTPKTRQKKERKPGVVLTPPSSSGCYPSYDKQWQWPVQLEGEFETQIPQYSTRSYFCDQVEKVQPTHHFKPGTTNFHDWKQDLRPKLRTLLGLDDQVVSPLNSRILSTEEFPDFKIEKIVFQSEPNVWVPTLLYIPHNLKGPARTLLHCHGHGSGLDQSLYSYIADFARRGYVVVSPEVRDFGERAFGKRGEMTCDRVYKLAAMLGKNLTGLRLWDFIRAIDYLETRQEVDPKRIACGGLSLGGELSMFLAAMEERIQCAFISGFVTTYEALEFRVNNCICYIIPGILNLCDMSDIVGLIAPRPVVVQSGIKDPWMPIYYTRQAFAEAQEIYQAAGASEKVVHDAFDGVHQFHGEVTFEMFDRWLPANG